MHLCALNDTSLRGYGIKWQCLRQATSTQSKFTNRIFYHNLNQIQQLCAPQYFSDKLNNFSFSLEKSYWTWVKVNSNPSPFNRKILVCPFELRNIIMGAAIPGGFKLRLFTEDLHISLILVLTNFSLAVTNNGYINEIKNTLNS